MGLLDHLTKRNCHICGKDLSVFNTVTLCDKHAVCNECARVVSSAVGTDPAFMTLDEVEEVFSELSKDKDL